MNGNLGSASEEFFRGLRPEVCGDARGKFLALEKLECLRAVLLSRAAALVVDLAVLAHLSDLPAWLDGAAIVPRKREAPPPELARAVAKAARNIRFTTRPEDYVPTSAVKTHVKAHDQHCPSPPAFEAKHRPGRHRRARTELDHSDPFNHKNPSLGGLTTIGNWGHLPLAGDKRLCKYHHRAAVLVWTLRASSLGSARPPHGRWRDIQLPDGTVIWISPSGQAYRTKPD